MTGTDTSSTAASLDATPRPPSSSARPGRSREPLVLGLTLLVLSILVVWGLPSYGIWDPWELGTADDARRLIEGETLATGRPPLGPWLVAQSFSVFGIHEWSGRFPIALAAIVLLCIAAALGRLYGDSRRGIYLAIATATTPLFLLNARHMMGLAPSFLASSLVFVCAGALAFPPRRALSPLWRGGLAIGLLLSIGLATAASGVLMGVAPPLFAVGVAIIARLPWEERPFALPSSGKLRVQVGIRWALVALAFAVALCTLHAVWANEEGYSWWIGGQPRGQTPPTFELPIEALFHSFAPWSAVLPLAVGFVMTYGSVRIALVEGSEEDDASAARGLDLAALAWVGLALAAQSIHAARYGDGAFVAVLGLSWMVASFLRATEDSSRGESWARGLVALLLIGLLVRDYRGYPGSPIEALSLRSFTMPDVFNPAGGWAATLGLFGLTTFFALASDFHAPQRSFASAMGATGVGGALVRAALPIDLVRAQWARGPGYRAWLVIGAVLTTLLVGFGVVAVLLSITTRGASDEDVLGVAGSTIRTSLVVGAVGTVVLGVAAIVLHRSAAAASRVGVRRVVTGLALLWLGLLLGAAIFSGIGWNSLAMRVGQVLLAVPFGVVLALGVARVSYFAMTSLRGASLVPMLLSAVVLAAWMVVRFHPQASTHFSPREVYDTYNALAQSDEPLGEYQVGGRAAAYYARSQELVELRSESDALTFLARPGRVWLALPTEQLAQLDRSYRQRASRHLFVADARNARVVLATNQPIEGRADENRLAGFVLDAPPAMQHRVDASFDRRIELLGYDLALPGGDSVGPGQSFAVTWYWRCVTPVPGGYQPFLHIDGFGQRLNGDHEPVEGHYPIRMWSEGDVVVDRHELRVPANFPPGDYTFYIGLYSGESRLEVVEGPEDDANRVAAGRLRVR